MHWAALPGYRKKVNHLARPLRLRGLLNQIETLFKPVELKGLSFTQCTLPNVLREIGAKQLGVDGQRKATTAAYKAWCWRNFDKWDARKPESFNKYIETGEVPGEEGDE